VVGRGTVEKPAIQIDGRQFSDGGSFSIQFPETSSAEITMTDMAGKVVWQQQLISKESFTSPALPLPNGIYLLRVQTPEQMQVKKLIRLQE
ncbi:MAG: T9SS type A sorting domain-containing protein, partial [Hymenobacteraceae bacterium]|nr:T9SS type A sorting domain-containing protein [Hymenobacteraceae bacterium]MDX5397701.1 T9SS type A sorting domain-containing protein [Hymenobacteraceae bacterium]MDX5513779.1 T9SS type A sorting domain-containing protein [Hymenobacteraceae bacterium]